MLGTPGERITKIGRVLASIFWFLGNGNTKISVPYGIVETMLECLPCFTGILIHIRIWFRTFLTDNSGKIKLMLKKIVNIDHWCRN